MVTRGWLLLGGREVELAPGEDTVMGRGVLLGIDNKRCSRRQAVLTFLPPATPSDPPFAVVAHGPNATYLKRKGAEERESLVRGEVYFLHDGDVLRLPPDYHPIQLRLTIAADPALSGSPKGDGTNGAKTHHQQAAVEDSQNEEALDDRRNDRRWAHRESNAELSVVANETQMEEEGPHRRTEGRLLGLLPDYRPLTMWWQDSSARDGTGGREEGREDETQTVKGGSDSSVLESGEAPQPAGGWIRRKRKSDDSRADRDAGEIRASGEEKAKEREEGRGGEEKEEMGEVEGRGEEDGMKKRRKTGLSERNDSAMGEQKRKRRARRIESDEGVAGRSDPPQATEVPVPPTDEEQNGASKMEEVEAEAEEGEKEEVDTGKGREEEDLVVLRAMFDGVGEDELRKVLRENGGDVNQTIDSLLNLIAIRNGEAGSLSIDDEGGGGRDVRTEAHERGEAEHEEDADDDGAAGEEDFGESEERIVDSIKDAIVEAMAESYIRRKGRHSEDHGMDEESDSGPASSGGTAADGAKEWACSVCTFVNQAADDECAMCGHAQVTERDDRSDDGTVSAGSGVGARTEGEAREADDARDKGKEKMDEEGEETKKKGEEEMKEGRGEKEEEEAESMEAREEREKREEAMKKKEIERQRREKLEKEDEGMKETSPGWGIRTSFSSTQERLYYHSQALTILPREVGRFKRLTILNLADNQLEWLPAEIGDLTSLEGLYLSNNRLKRLPPELGKLAKLERLYLDVNQLEEVEDEAVAGLARLEELVLSHNLLTQIPFALRSLPRLLRLDVQHNQVATIPPTLFLQDETFTCLRMLSLSANPLRCLPYALHHFIASRAIAEFNSCKFGELERDTKWERLPNRSARFLVRLAEGSAAVVPLFQQCLTYLYRTDKESIDTWGLPDHITSYLWDNLDRCCGCEQAFVGPGVGEAIELLLLHPTSAEKVPVRGNYCSLRCATQESDPAHTSAGS